MSYAKFATKSELISNAIVADAIIEVSEIKSCDLIEFSGMLTPQCLAMLNTWDSVYPFNLHSFEWTRWCIQNGHFYSTPSGRCSQTVNGVRYAGESPDAFEVWLNELNLNFASKWMMRYAKNNNVRNLDVLIDKWVQYKQINICLSNFVMGSNNPVEVLDNTIQPDWETHVKINAIKTASYRFLELGISSEPAIFKFLELYKKYSVKGRSFNSSKQIALGAITTIAKNQEYWCLPEYVIKSLIGCNAPIPDGGRIGDVWDYISASKMWKVDRNIPKKIAVRLGKEPLWKRYAASTAWTKTMQTLTVMSQADNYRGYTITDKPSSLDEVSKSYWLNVYSHEYENGHEDMETELIDRSELINNFWKEYQKEISKGKFEVIKRLITPTNGWDQAKPFMYRQSEAILGLPNRHLNGNESLEDLYRYLDPNQVLMECFGVNTKSLRKAWDQAIKNADNSVIKWAIALAPKGNSDIACHFLNMEWSIAHYEECVPMLQTLQYHTAIRMLQTTTYKNRGEVHQLQDFHFKDTGMLFNNIVESGNEPRLGRVRCWLTLHEELGRQYIKTQPDSPVAVNPKWQPVNGLSGVNGDWRIQVPTSTAELKWYGEQLSNCVGGYGNNINNGKSIVFVVYWHNTLKYCCEVSPNGYVQQFYGHHNSYPDGVEKELICSVLRDDAKLIH